MYMCTNHPHGPDTYPIRESSPLSSERCKFNLLQHGPQVLAPLLTIFLEPCLKLDADRCQIFRNGQLALFHQRRIEQCIEQRDPEIGLPVLEMTSARSR